MKKNIKYGVTKELFSRFLIHITLYTVILLFLFAIGYLLGHSRLWYADTPEYYFFHFIQDYWPIFFLIFLLVGCLVIAGMHIMKFSKILEEITGAVSDLSSQRTTYIKLPSQLYEVESELNQILSQMQQNHQIAKEAEQRKNDMIVYMAHDLKTPLTSVIGYLTLLHDEKAISNEFRDKHLGIALRKSECLEELINAFFEMTKYNFSNTVLTITKVNLSLMLEQIIFEFQLMFQEKGVDCQIEIEKNLLLPCDVEKMERVFDNLFKNALHYCYENSTIFVKLKSRPENDGILLSIQNAGKTIPKEMLDHLFEQFFRMDSSRSSKTGGSGLGLAIAKEIITLHHGTITCDSENETITFTVYLPY
ncbi:MAG: HAMP domain-containing sensor histidine kinase [Lachnospiraceae bacterium]|nr:HAMP domain-containing sensor histidine kinase [Lachnospiraceae bacterium]